MLLFEDESLEQNPGTATIAERADKPMEGTQESVGRKQTIRTVHLCQDHLFQGTLGEKSDTSLMRPLSWNPRGLPPFA
jgi:hypothetical protein